MKGKTIRRALLLLCDTAWTKSHLIRGWRMTGADITVEHFGTDMGRDWDAAGERRHRERNAKWRATAAGLAADGGLDLVFIVALDDVLEAETIAFFKSLGAKVVLYNTDMLTQWYKIIRSCRQVDLLCMGSPDHVAYFEKAGIPMMDFGFAALPPSPEELAAPAADYEGVLFMGSPWPYRQKVLQRLADEGIPLRVYGHSWDRKGAWPRAAGRLRKAAHDLRHYLIPRAREEGRELASEALRRLLAARSDAVEAGRLPSGVVRGSYEPEQFVPLLRGAAINLGFTQMPLDPAREFPRMIRLREFEVPITGAFYLTQSCPELPKYFEPGREVAVWDTAADAAERCRYYLGRPEERARIAAAGRRRALENHTWLHRFSSLARRLDMTLPVGSPSQARPA